MDKDSLNQCSKFGFGTNLQT